MLRIDGFSEVKFRKCMHLEARGFMKQFGVAMMQKRAGEYVDQRSENLAVRTCFPHKTFAQAEKHTLAFSEKSERGWTIFVAECRRRKLCSTDTLRRRQLGYTDSLLCRRQGARPCPPLERRSVAATSWWRIAQAKSTS